MHRHLIVVDFISLTNLKKSIMRVDITAHVNCFPEAFGPFVYLILSCVTMDVYYSCKLFYFPFFYFMAAVNVCFYARLFCLRCQALAAYLIFLIQTK